MQIILLNGCKYRYLCKGENIEKNDIFVPDDNDDEMAPGYFPVWESLIGQKWDDNMEPIVRKTI